MLEQWVEHLVKVGVPVNEIGMYDGDRSRKHGLLRACERDKQARSRCVLGCNPVDRGCRPTCRRMQPCVPRLRSYVSRLKAARYARHASR